MSSACLIFDLYLNQISHLKMFLTSHLMTKRTRSQTKFRYIFVICGHVLVPLCVPMRLCSLLVFSNLLIFIHANVHFRLFLLLFCFYLWSPHSFVSLQASSWLWRSSYFSWVHIIVSLWHNTSSNTCLV